MMAPIFISSPLFNFSMLLPARRAGGRSRSRSQSRLSISIGAIIIDRRRYLSFTFQVAGRPARQPAAISQLDS